MNIFLLLRQKSYLIYAPNFVWVDGVIEKKILKESKMKKLMVIMMVASLALLAVNCQKKAKVEETPAAPVDTTAVVDTVKA